MKIEITDQHQEILKQFTKRIEDCKLPYEGDSYLLKWLIARDFDIPKAEKMLRNSLEWRKKFRIDELSHWQPPEVFRKYYPVSMTGLDKHNNRVWIAAMGRIDLKGLIQSMKKKDYVRSSLKYMESDMAYFYSNQNRNEMLYTCVIFDMEHLSMRHITDKSAMGIILQILQYQEANYPEIMCRAYVINAPRIFSIVWALIRPFMHENTAKKVQIFGHDKAQWKAALLENIDPSELPAFYGGSRTDPDGNPQWLSKVCMGGEIPKMYYMNNSKPDLNLFEKTIIVSNASRERLEFNIQEDAIFEWQIFSEDGDIAFSIVRENENENCKEIIPRERVDCHLFVEEGEICCSATGKYVVEFDNTYSYLRSKKIWYTFAIYPKIKN